MGGEGMPQQVRMNRFRNTGFLRRFPTSQEDRFYRDGPRGILTGKQPAGGSLRSPVATQELQQFGRQQGLSILSSLPRRTQSTLRALSMSLALSWVTSETLSPEPYKAASRVR